MIPILIMVGVYIGLIVIVIEIFVDWINQCKNYQNVIQEGIVLKSNNRSITDVKRDNVFKREEQNIRQNKIEVENLW